MLFELYQNCAKWGFHLIQANEGLVGELAGGSTLADRTRWLERDKAFVAALFRALSMIPEAAIAKEIQSIGPQECYRIQFG